MVVATPKTPPKSLLDEYGEYQRRYDAFRPTLKRLKELKKEIDDYFAGADPAASWELEGERYMVQVGARKRQRSIVGTGLRKLFRLLGAKRFLEHCSFGVTEFDELDLPAEGIVIEKRSGPREITAVVKPIAERLEAAKAA